MQWLFTGLLWVGLAGWAFAEMRIWTDHTGQTVEARLLDQGEDATIQLQLADGTVITVALAHLSEADQAFLLEAIEQEEEVGPGEGSPSEHFEIRRIRPSRSPGFIATDEGFELRVNCMLVEVRYIGPKPSEKAFVKAYFYDDAGTLLAAFDEPPRRQTNRGNVYIHAPKTFAQGELQELYFPISRSLVNRRWRTILAVFGNEEEVTVLSRPPLPLEAIAHLEFAERNILFPDLPAEDAASPSPAVGGDFALGLRRINTRRHNHQVYFNGAYVSGVNVLFVEVGVLEGVPQGELTLRAFFFDDDRELVDERAPATTDMGGRNYVKTPVLAQSNRWYPAFFALDGTLAERGAWRWAIVQAEVGDVVIAELFGPSDAELGDFEWPRKAAFQRARQ